MSKRFLTSATFAGSVSTNTGSGQAILGSHLDLGDNQKVRVGAGNDLQIFHTGSVTTFDNFTGNLQFVQAADDADIVFQNDDGSGGLTEYFRIDGSSAVNIFSKHVRLFDDVQLQVGNGQDLKIFHDGTNSEIRNQTGDLTIRNDADDKDIVFQSDNGSGGITEYFRIDGSTERIESSKSFRFTDGARAQFGASSDMQIYHDGANSLIENGTGDLTIDNQGDDLLLKAADDFLVQVQSSDIAIQAVGNGKVGLRFDNVEKFETTSTGISVTGNGVFSGSLDVNGAVSTFGAAGTGTNDAIISIDGGSGTGGEAYLRLTRGGTSGFILNHTASNIQVRTTANIPTIFYTNDTVALTLDTSQNATFSGSVTASSFIKSGGTSSQYLMADGSVSTSTSPFDGGTITNNLTISNSSPALNLTDTDNSSNIAFSSVGGALIVNSASDQVYQIGGAEKMRLNSSGNLGIGTTSIGARLEVAASATTSVDIAHFSNSNSVQKAIIGLSSVGSGQLVLRDAGNNEDVLISSHGDSYFNGGNIGIGTTSPSVQLDIEDSSNVIVDMNTTTANANTTIRLQESGSVKATIGYDGTNDGLILTTGGFTAGNGIFINDSKNVGIGTASPDTELHIAHNSDDGASGWLTIEDTDTTAGSQRPHIVFQGNGTEIGRIRVLDTTGMQFATSSSTSLAMTIDQSQKVGIGTTSPERKLHVNSSFTNIVATFESTDATAAISLQDDSTTNDSKVQVRAIGDDFNIVAGGTQRLTILNTGSVGIGTTSPVSQFEVYGGTSGTNDVDRYVRFKASNGEKRFDFYVGGTGNASSLGMYTSDGTTKNVQIASGGTSYFNGGNVGIGTTSPLVKLEVNGVLYSRGGTWNGGGSESDHTVVGFVIQEGHFIFTRDGSNLRRLIGKTNDIIEIGQAGTSLIDGISFLSGTTPLYRWYNNTSEIMRLNATGLGIGTTSPDTKLNVVKGGAGEQVIAIFENSTNADETKASIQLRNATNDVCSGKIISHRTGANFGADLAFELSDNVDGTFRERMRITEVGNVGIGTNNPQENLHIKDPSDGIPVFRLEGGSRTFQQFVSGNGFFIRDVTASSNRILLDANGRVGIGTTSPSEKLHIASSANPSIKIQDITNSFGEKNTLFFNQNIVAGQTDVAKIYTELSNGATANLNNPLKFATAQRSTLTMTDRMVIDNLGNVGIGTTSPDTILHIESASATGAILNLETTHTGGIPIYNMKGAHSAQLRYQDENGNNQSRIDFNDGGDFNFIKATDGTSYLKITSAGNVGIGTTSPNAKTHIFGGSDSQENVLLKVQSNGVANDSSLSTSILLANSTALTSIHGAKISAIRTGSGTDDLVFSVYNTSMQEKMRIDSSGNVGIGTTAPSEKLHIVGDTYISGVGNKLLFDTTSGLGSNGIKTINDFETLIFNGRGAAGFAVIGNSNIRLGFGSNYTNAETDLFIKSDGNVGIGDTNPTTKLSVNGTIKVTGSGTGLLLYGTGGGGNIDAFGSNPLLLMTNSTERMRIDSQGFIGIGTTSPQSKLDIVNSGLATQLRLSNTTANSTTKFGAITGRHYNNSEENVTGMLITSNSSVIGGSVSIGGGITSANAANQILFYTAANNTTLTGTERMRIDASGNVGIGTTSPGAKLDVNGNVYVRSTGSLFVDTIAGYTSGVITLNSNTNFIVPSGNVGIGTTSPDDALSVTGDIGLYGSTSSGAVTHRALHFYTSEDAAGLSGSNKQAIGEIAFSGKDSSLNAAGKYAHIKSYIIDTNNNIQGSAGEGGQLEFTILRHDVGAQARVERTALTINNSANVGIGTNNPSSKLTINTGTGSDSLRFERDSQETYRITHGTSGLFFTHPNSTALLFGLKQDGDIAIFNDQSSEYVRFDNLTSSVGIGVTSPNAKLEISGTSEARYLQVDAIAGFAGISSSMGAMVEFFNSGDGNNVKIKTNNSSRTDAAPFSVWTDSNSRFLIRNDGNVGIGTTSPDTKLDVSSDGRGASAPTIRITNTFGTGDWSGDTNDLGRFEFFTDDASGNAPYTLGYIAVKNDFTTGTPTLPSGAMIFATTTYNASGGAVERMRITSVGKVGIGTGNPNDRLNIHDGSANANLGIKITRGSQTHGLRLGVNDSHAFLWTDQNQDLAFATNNSQRLTIQAGGNVGIGKTVPSQKLDVAGIGQFAGAIRITETGTAQHILIGNQDSGGTNKPGMIRSANASLEFGYGNSWSGEGGTMTTSLTIGSDSNATFAGYVAATQFRPTNIVTNKVVKFDGTRLDDSIITDNGTKVTVAGDVDITSGLLAVGQGNNGENRIEIGKDRTTNGFAYIDLVGDATYSDFGLRIIRGSTGANAPSIIEHRGTGDFSIKATEVANLILETSNAERMRITPGGSVGIGITNPSYLLETKDVGITASNARFGTGTVRMGGTADAGSNQVLSLAPGRFGMDAPGVVNGRFIIEENGRVGVGIASPEVKTHIFANDTSNKQLMIDQDSTGDAVMSFRLTGVSEYVMGIDNSDGDKFKIANSGTVGTATRLTIDSSGYVGINQTSPTRQLHILNSSGDNRGIMVENTVATSYAEVHIKAAREFRIGTGGSSSDSNSSDRFFIFDATASTHRFTISSTGNVGIGITTPSTKLDVNGDGRFLSNSSSRVLYLKQQSANNGNIIQFENQSGTNVWELVGRNNQFYIYNNALSSFAFYINPSNSNIGIGNSNPTQKLHVTGSVLASSDVVAFSDKKLKENIKTLDGSKVYDMRGVSFTRKDTGKDSSGVIAQEIQKIAPELVADNNGTLSVAYGNLTGYLIEAVKELKAEIEELKKHKCDCKK